MEHTQSVVADAEQRLEDKMDQAEYLITGEVRAGAGQVDENTNNRVGDLAHHVTSTATTQTKIIIGAIAGLIDGASTGSGQGAPPVMDPVVVQQA